jgi:FKBP-type peptidyl-prolyl cis-trans isomerase FklB
MREISTKLWHLWSTLIGPAAVLALAACSQTDAQNGALVKQPGKPAAAATGRAEDRGSAAYRFGVSVGNQLRDAGLALSDVDINELTDGLTQALLGIAERPPGENARYTAGRQILAEQGKGRGSFNLGVSMGNELRERGLTGDDINPHEVSDGVSDALAGKPRLPPADEAAMVATTESSVAATEARNRTAAREFLAKNSKLPGVVTTPTGLQYRVIVAGAGRSPGREDVITFHYRGTLQNGSEFDSTHQRREPARTGVATLIRGLQEALLLMKPGAKWEIYIPPEHGYEKLPPEGIPPGSLLRFEVELLAVEPTA